MSKRYLHSLAWNLNLQEPRYETTSIAKEGFKACVTVKGCRYHSHEICRRKKWAEAAAAEIALCHLCKDLGRIAEDLVERIMARRKLGMPKYGVKQVSSSSSSCGGGGVEGFRAWVNVGESIYWGSVTVSANLAKTNAAIEAFNALCAEFNSAERSLSIFERSIGPYSSKHDILLVGEGDFSFSLCLARAFGSAHRMVCTSLDSRAQLLCYYSSACRQILSALEAFGAKILHNVDAKKMKDHPVLKEMRFDRIVWNFPHAGFGKIRGECNRDQIRKHKELVEMFLRNAKTLVKKSVGEIHITHRTGQPYDQWEITEQAQKCGLLLKNADPFCREDYEGYINRKSYMPNPEDRWRTSWNLSIREF